MEEFNIKIDYKKHDILFFIIEMPSKQELLDKCKELR